MRYISLVALCALLLTSCTVFQKSADSSSAKNGDETEEDDPFKPWEKTLKDTEKIEGFFTLHQKEDRTLYAEVSPDQLGQDFGMVMHISSGVGVFNLHDGLPLSDTRLMRFRRVGQEVQLVHRNPRFRADEGPMRASQKDNTGHSVVHTFDIVSRHDSTKHLLIELSDFLVSDYANVSERIKPYFNNKPVRFEEDRSTLDRAMGFPENVEVDVSLTYEGSDPPLVGQGAVPDYRAIPVGVRYSFFQLPETPMQARLADDRVGHFTNAVKDFSRDKQSDPYLRYVQRWRLAPDDTAAYKRGELVEPEEPIVYYVDHTVPTEYRPYVKQGIEAWNKAFREAGYKNAVVAKDAPDDSTWSAEDVRYSTVRWTAAHQMGYAIGPSQTDPRTGEILNADVLISSEFVRGWRQTYDRLIPGQTGGAVEGTKTGSGPKLGQGLGLQQTSAALRQMFPSHLARRACWAERGMAQQLGLQRALLVGRGVIEPDASLPEEYLGDAIRDLVMHEIGHTLGLRHNFKASSGIDTERLHDESYTKEHGVSLSVMDYAPVNVALDSTKQGHYWNQTVGTYDEWAIKYAYLPVTEQSAEGSLTRSGALADTAQAERAALNKIAAQSSDPMHRYGTDEDNWLGAYAVDPLTNAWELGSDPLAYAQTRSQLVQQMRTRLETRLIADGERYYPLRQATTALIVERYRSLLPVTKVVGGLYVARDHKGTPDARTPLRPVSAEKQREAVDLLVEAAFAPDAFTFEADYLNKLAPNRHYHWGTQPSLPVDYPVHRYVSTVQSSLLQELLHPARLQRMIDNQKRTDDEASYEPGELLQRLTTSIWSELGTAGTAPQPINSFRRSLQRTYVDFLIRHMMNTTSWVTLTIAGGDQVDTPEDVRSLARLELTELSDRMEQVLNRGAPDRTTRAHLAETKARIDRALEASLDVTP